MRRLATSLCALLCIGAATGPERPRRIVSMNLCADQLLLALADRDQIAGLTSLAHDPEMSAEAGRASGLRALRGSAEEVMGLQPDLVIGQGPGPVRLPAPLANGRERTLELDSDESYAKIVANIRRVAAATGHADRGAALVARMDVALAGIVKVGRGRTAAYYQRRGYLTGAGTLVDELMGRVGLVNLATRLGKPALSQLSLEELIAARPDYLIVESGTDRVTDQGSEMLHHPALDGIPRLRVPRAWTVCGGPSYVLAAQGLARQIAARRADGGGDGIHADPSRAVPQKFTRTPP